jgi:hypothetical protein
MGGRRAGSASRVWRGSEMERPPKGVLLAPAQRFRTSAARRRIRNSADVLRRNRNSPRMIASAPSTHGAQSMRWGSGHAVRAATRGGRWIACEFPRRGSRCDEPRGSGTTRPLIHVHVSSSPAAGTTSRHRDRSAPRGEEMRRPRPPLLGSSGDAPSPDSMPQMHSSPPPATAIQWHARTGRRVSRRTPAPRWATASPPARTAGIRSTRATAAGGLGRN